MVQEDVGSFDVALTWEFQGYVIDFMISSTHNDHLERVTLLSWSPTQVASGRLKDKVWSRQDDDVECRCL